MIRRDRTDPGDAGGVRVGGEPPSASMSFSCTDPRSDAAAASAAAAREFPAADGCLGRTCLKWAPDGKLTAFDLQMVLQKLRQVDHQLAGQEEEPVGSPGLQAKGT